MYTCLPFTIYQFNQLDDPIQGCSLDFENGGVRSPSVVLVQGASLHKCICGKLKALLGSKSIIICDC